MNIYIHTYVHIYIINYIYIYTCLSPLLLYHRTSFCGREQVRLAEGTKPPLQVRQRFPGVLGQGLRPACRGLGGHRTGLRRSRAGHRRSSRHLGLHRSRLLARSRTCTRGQLFKITVPLPPRPRTPAVLAVCPNGRIRARAGPLRPGGALGLRRLSHDSVEQQQAYIYIYNYI